MSKVNLNVFYNGDRKIIECKRSEVLSTIANHWKIKEDDIEIFERNSTKKINVEELKSVMMIEVKRKNSSINNPSCNGAATSARESQHDATIKKLRGNSTLTGLERQNLIDLIVRYGSTSIQKKSKKIQVDFANPNPKRDVECQTEPISNPSPSKRHLETNDDMYQMKRLASAEKVDPVKAKKLMDKSFSERRNTILMKAPLASFVKETYPLLFSLAEVRNEIDRIMIPGKCKQFLHNVEKYSKYVLSMAREDDPLLIKTQKKVASYPTIAQKKYAEQVGSLLMISSLMQEERGYLNLTDKPIEKSLFPYIEAQAKLSDIFFDEHLFKVYVEGQLLCVAVDFKEAILCLIGTYYIFNIKYQEDISNTYTAFEQLYLERKDTDELDDCVEQIIQTIRLKAEASYGSSSRS